MANLSWPTLHSSTSTTTSTTNPDFVDPTVFTDNYIDPDSAVSRTNAIALGPTLSGATLSLRAAATTIPDGWASAQDWDKYRALITELYPKLMLKKIMEVMAIEHNFKATEKMYKSRFTQWGLRKNAKRKGDGDQQSGREKRPIDRSRHLPAADAGHLIPIVSSANPRTMKSSTPLSHPLTTPPMFAIPERILGVIWDYFRGSFEAGTWVSNGDGSEECISIKRTKPVGACLHLLYNQTVLACRLFDRNSFQDAGKALISATARTREILLAEDPVTLITLLKTIFETHHRGRDEIAFAILRQYSAMAMAVLGEKHPMCRIPGWLSSMHPSQFDAVIKLLSTSACDHFASFLGPMHFTALTVRMGTIEYSGETEEKLRDLLGKCKNDLGLLDCRTFNVGLELSWKCYEKYKFTEAKKLSQELLVRSQKVQSCRFKNHFQAESLYMIAMYQYALGERHSSESKLLDAIALHSQTGPSRAVYLLSILEEWQLKQGREDSAAETRERRMKLQDTLESD